jgi:predicted nucleic acid-binding protein
LVAKIILLDAGPLGMVSHPRPADEILAWVARLLAAGVQVLVPEIADYEVRRELLRARLAKSVRRLDQLRATLGFLPITTSAMLQAAEFWADTRRRGRPTAHELTLDADAILAGQAATISGQEVVVATGNPRHIARFVPAQPWEEIGP